MFTWKGSHICNIWVVKFVEFRQIIINTESIKRNLFRDKKMSEAKLETIPNVDIDEGIFKYVLIKVFGKDDPNGSELSKIIVRGYKDCNWHSDIYERIISSCQGLSLETKCLGGGRIEHNSSNKYIKIYGYSQGYGKADHAESRKILLEKYPSYTIDISDEGY